MDEYSSSFAIKYKFTALAQHEFFKIPEYFLWFAVLVFILMLVATFIWPRWIKSSEKLGYKGEQRVHDGEVPRLGGAAIYVSLILTLLTIKEVSLQEELKQILWFILPVMLISVKEDIFHNTSVGLRVSSLIITALLILNGPVDNWPSISNLGVISTLFEFPAFNVAFFSLCLIALANGFNFIDGMNGLLGFYCLGVLIACLNLALLVGDVPMTLIICLLTIAIIIFLVFNFPLGKIFFGDSGAFLLGLMLGAWVINFFAKYDAISSWNAALIFFYPTIEVTYSVIRKIIQKKSPFYPDRCHLHLKIYDLINKGLKRPRVANSLTTVFLAIFWLAPPLVLPLVYHQQQLIFLSIFFLSILYLSLNWVIPEGLSDPM